MIAFFAGLIEDRRFAVWTVGALAIIGGSIAPWVHVASPLRPLTELGLDADGKITLLCGVAALGLVAAAVRLRGRDLAAGALLLAAVSGALSVTYLLRVRDASSRVLARMLAVDDTAVRSDFAARAGLGVWLVAAGSLLVAIAALALLRRAGDDAPAPSEPPHDGTKRSKKKPGKQTFTVPSHDPQPPLTSMPITRGRHGSRTRGDEQR